MPDIKNETELAQELAEQAESEGRALVLYQVLKDACRNVPAEQECNSTYEKGIRQTGEHRLYKLQAKGFIDRVNQILKEADEAAKQGNLPEGGASDV